MRSGQSPWADNASRRQPPRQRALWPSDSRDIKASVGCARNRGQRSRAPVPRNGQAEIKAAAKDLPSLTTGRRCTGTKRRDRSNRYSRSRI